MSLGHITDPQKPNGYQVKKDHDSPTDQSNGFVYWPFRIKVT